MTDITDVHPKESQPTEAPAVQAPTQPSLRSLYDNGKFSVGILMPDGVQPDGSVTLAQAITYSNVDLALQELEMVMVHCRRVRDDLIYQAGYRRGTDEASTPKVAANVTATPGQAA